MIGYLRGDVQHFDGETVTLSLQGCGYEIHVSSIPDIAPTQIGLWIHEHAPQDAPHELYGFREREERDLFRRLLNIKGVGPKVAMRIVANGHRQGNFDQLAMTKIRGIGTTLAQRICEALS
jgi:Holliday junction DNA helicase RuvA